MQSKNTLPPEVMVSKNTIYAIQGNIYALEISNGTIQQVYPVEGIALSSVEDDVLYMNVSKYPDYIIQALRVQDCALIWNYTTKERLSGAPIVANSVVYTSMTDGAVSAFHARDGALLWQYRVNLGSEIPAYLGPILVASPTIVNETLYISPAVNRPLQPFVYALNA